jgi:hypothetical protein
MELLNYEFLPLNDSFQGQEDQFLETEWSQL